jgi:hypothetical protein
MPLQDDYQTEKELALIAEAIATGITELLIEEHKEKNYGFALFVFDTTSATLQYISDLPKEISTEAIRFWLSKEIQ